MRGLLPAVPLAGTRYDVLNINGQLILITICIGIQALKILYTMIVGVQVSTPPSQQQ